MHSVVLYHQQLDTASKAGELRSTTKLGQTVRVPTLQGLDSSVIWKQGRSESCLCDTRMAGGFEAGLMGTSTGSVWE